MTIMRRSPGRIGKWLGWTRAGYGRYNPITERHEDTYDSADRKFWVLPPSASLALTLVRPPRSSPPSSSSATRSAAAAFKEPHRPVAVDATVVQPFA